MFSRSGPQDHVFSLDTPRDPARWATVEARPVPDWTLDPEEVGKGLSGLGFTIGPGLIAKAREMGVELQAELEPQTPLPPARILEFLNHVAGHFFPRLATVPTDALD